MSKIERIINKVVNDIPDVQKAQWLADDVKIRNLEVDLRKAQKGSRKLSESIINRQLVSRGRLVIEEHTHAIIQKLIMSGDIIHYLDEDDAREFNHIRGMIYLLYDAIDSVFVDFTGFIHKIGVGGEVVPLRKITEARHDIECWCKETTHVEKEFKQATDDESDRLYEHVKTRMEVLQRKVDRIAMKLIKENGNNNSNPA